MDNEKAIQILKREEAIKFFMPMLPTFKEGSEPYEATKLAIEALQEPGKQAAIDVLQKEIDHLSPPANELFGAFRMGVRAAKNLIEDLPSLPPSERESGEWVKRISGNGWNEWTDLYCPKCETKYSHVDHPSHYNFCPNCGAYMRGDKE